MLNKQAHNQYRTVQFTTIDRGRLLLMMYEGCLKFLGQAKEALEARDIAKFARFLSKSQAIISELMNTLDFEKGGKIARDLDRLYDFMLFYLTEANLHKDPQKIQRVIKMMESISDAYHDIINSGKAERELKAMGEPMEAIGPKRTEVKPANAPAAEMPKTPNFRSSF
ncbi:MAG: flagellar export chaperone FliS [Deltaproteobacteria bacterium]|nr:flagellar export chaperone FliS [Deltaproteobacteria bacterium]